MLTKDSIKRIAQSVDIKSEVLLPDSEYGQMFFNDVDRYYRLVNEHVSNLKLILKEKIDKEVYEYISNVFPTYVEPEGDKYEKEFVRQILTVVDTRVADVTSICEDLMFETLEYGDAGWEGKGK